LSESRDRSAPGRETRGREAREEVAFAPTIVSDRRGSTPPSEDARAISLTKRKSAGRIATGVAAPDESRVVPSAGLDDPFEIPKRSRAGLWVVLLLTIAGGGAAAMRWAPGLRGAASDAILRGAASSSSAGSPPESTSQSPPPAPSAASGPSGSVAAAGGAVPSRSATRVAGDPQGPPRAATSTISATGALDASAALSTIGAPAAADAGPSVTADASAAPASNSPDDDPNNPYNVPSPPNAPSFVGAEP